MSYDAHIQIRSRQNQGSGFHCQLGLSAPASLADHQFPQRRRRHIRSTRMGHDIDLINFRNRGQQIQNLFEMEYRKITRLSIFEVFEHARIPGRPRKRHRNGLPPCVMPQIGQRGQGFGEISVHPMHIDQDVSGAAALHLVFNRLAELL